MTRPNRRSKGSSSSATRCFAIAITLLALEIKAPSAGPQATEAAWEHALLDLTPSFFAFGLSFFVIGSVWTAHHSAFRLVRRFDQRLMTPNLLLLLAIVLVPFSSTLLAVTDRVPAPVRVLFGGHDAGGCQQGVADDRGDEPHTDPARRVAGDGQSGPAPIVGSPDRRDPCPLGSPSSRRPGTTWRCCSCSSTGCRCSAFAPDQEALPGDPGAMRMDGRQATVLSARPHRQAKFHGRHVRRRRLHPQPRRTARPLWRARRSPRSASRARPGYPPAYIARTPSGTGR